MKHELQQQLFDEFPIFFRDRHLEGSLIKNICIADECFEPLLTFCKAVKKVNELLPDNEAIVAQQIKTKWSQIEIYTNRSFGANLRDVVPVFPEKVKQLYRDAYCDLRRNCAEN